MIPPMTRNLLLGFLTLSPPTGHHFRPFIAHTPPRALQGRLRHSKRNFSLVSLLSTSLRLDATLDWSPTVALRSSHQRHLLGLLILRGELAPIRQDNHPDKLVSVPIQGPPAFSQLGQVRVEDLA